MQAPTRRLRITVAVALGLIAPLALLACGNGDDNVSSVAVQDAGSHDATTDAKASSDATVAADAAADACLADAAARCNACSSDPSTACSIYAGKCIPFDAARVPPHPML